MLDNFKKNWITTVTGIILLISTVLVTLGVLTPEQSTGVQENSSIILNAVGQIIAAVSALVLMFKAKD